MSYNVDHSFSYNGAYGSLFVPQDAAGVGVVLGPGILGNRYGLEDVAKTIVKENRAHVITLDPPSHHENVMKFTFANYAKIETLAAQYLRTKYDINKVVGGGHSGGAIAGLFANMRYTGEKEALAMQYWDSSSIDEYDVGLALEECSVGQTNDGSFDGLILASLPKNVRTAMPSYAFNPFFLKMMQTGFHMQNKGNKTNFLGKLRERPYQWKHLSVHSLKETKEYATSALNPVEYLQLLHDCSLGEDMFKEVVDNVQSTPKLFLVPGRDIVSFGPKVFVPHLLRKKGVEQDLALLRQNLDFLGVDGGRYHEFPHDAHFLNGKFEGDSLYGLQGKDVQEKIVDFVQEFAQK